MVARRIEQPAEKSGGAAHLPFRFQSFKAQHHRCPMLADPASQTGNVAFAMVGGLNRHMAIAVGQGDEIALGIDHHLLDLARAFLEQAAEQVRLAAARIALHQQAGRQQLLQVDRDGVALPVDAHVHAHRHCNRPWQAEESSPSLRVGQCQSIERL